MRTGNRTQAFEWCHFQWPQVTSNPDVKVTPLVDAEYLKNDRTDKHSYNKILTGTYTRRTQGFYFEWPWVIVSDLAKYLMTLCIAQSLCSSWASCLSSTVFRVLSVTVFYGSATITLQSRFVSYALSMFNRSPCILTGYSRRRIYSISVINKHQNTESLTLLSSREICCVYQLQTPTNWWQWRQSVVTWPDCGVTETGTRWSKRP